MNMKRFAIPAVLLSIVSAAVAGDYPSESGLWKSFNATPGSRVHVNRVFVRPDEALRKEKKYRKHNEQVAKANARFRARRVIRRKALDRIFSDFVPGEKAVILREKYDLFHERCYIANVVTQRSLYYIEMYEVPEKGCVITKYALTDSEFKNFRNAASKLKHSDGSCEMTDSRDYPTFISVRDKSGKWMTVVCSSITTVFNSPNEKQTDFYRKISGVVSFVSEFSNFKRTRVVPPVIVKK